MAMRDGLLWWRAVQWFFMIKLKGSVALFCLRSMDGEFIKYKFLKGQQMNFIYVTTK